MTEIELQRLVAELCAELGLHHYHEHDSRRNTLAVPGFPDSVIVGRRIIFRELKSKNGVLEPAQRRWGSRIERADGDWALWRPADWYSGIIRQQLTDIQQGRA